MTVYLDGVRQAEGFSGGPANGQALLVLAAPGEGQAALAFAGLDVAADPVNTENPATRFEARTGYDYISVQVPEFAGELRLGQPVNVYYNASALVVVGREAEIAAGLAQRMGRGDAYAPHRVLYHLFSLLYAGDGEYLEDIEEELLDLEALVVQKQPKDCTAQIMAIRRRLLLLKRYYEALYDLLEDLEENLNGFIPKRQLNSFRIHTNRADRLTNTVMNLRDYAGQVREAYQNQLDISLNETMKLFTVITAIFLPLTLVAGWYGMNLQMPEYGFSATYPLVLLGSIAIVAGLLVYFKRKKWF